MRRARAAAPINGARGPNVAGSDLEAADERQAGALVELVLCGAEERLAEPERDRTTDDRQLEVAQRADRCQRPADHHAGSFDDGGRGALRWPAGLGLDRLATAVGLEATLAPADAWPPVGLDDDVTDVAGVADPALQQVAATDDATADAGAHHDADEVADADRTAAPRLGERQCPGIGVDRNRQLHELLHLR